MGSGFIGRRHRSNIYLVNKTIQFNEETIVSNLARFISGLW
jgi:hypothetical protein